jgi:hypothetical protein
MGSGVRSSATAGSKLIQINVFEAGQEYPVSGGNRHNAPQSRFAIADNFRSRLILADESPGQLRAQQC